MPKNQATDYESNKLVRSFNLTGYGQWLARERTKSLAGVIWQGWATLLAILLGGHE